jgi:hypothetical protein
LVKKVFVLYRVLVYVSQPIGQFLKFKNQLQLNVYITSIVDHVGVTTMDVTYLNVHAVRECGHYCNGLIPTAVKTHTGEDMWNTFGGQERMKRSMRVRGK